MDSNNLGVRASFTYLRIAMGLTCGLRVYTSKSSKNMCDRAEPGGGRGYGRSTHPWLPPFADHRDFECNPTCQHSALQGPQRTARRGRPAVHDRRARSAVRRRRWLASQTQARCERRRTKDEQPARTACAAYIVLGSTPRLYLHSIG
jgi:hypothetical protein